MNILDEINERLKRIEAQLAKQPAKPAKPSGKSAEMAGYPTAAKLCEQYSISRDTLKRWLNRMKAAGFPVEIRRFAKSQRAMRHFCASDFDRGFRNVILCDEKEVA